MGPHQAPVWEDARVAPLASGKAARLAGMGRVAFLHELARIGAPAINLREEEVEAEIAAARELAGTGLRIKVRRIQD